MTRYQEIQGAGVAAESPYERLRAQYGVGGMNAQGTPATGATPEMPSYGTMVRSQASRVAQGVSGATVEPLLGALALSQRAQPGDVGGAEWLERARLAVQQAVAGLYSDEQAQVDAAFKDMPGLGGKAARFATGVAPRVAGSLPTALLGGPGFAGAMGAMQMGVQDWYDAKSKGASDFKAGLALATGAGFGATEALGIGRALSALSKAGGGSVVRRILTEGLSEGIEEGVVQEGLLQGILHNLAVAKLWDPERGWADGVTDGMIAGTLFGGVVGGLVGAGQQPAPALTPGEMAGADAEARAGMDPARGVPGAAPAGATEQLGGAAALAPEDRQAISQANQQGLGGQAIPVGPAGTVAEPLESLEAQADAYQRGDRGPLWVDRDIEDPELAEFANSRGLFATPGAQGVYLALPKDRRAIREAARREMAATTPEDVERVRAATLGYRAAKPDLDQASVRVRETLDDQGRVISQEAVDDASGAPADGQRDVPLPVALAGRTPTPTPQPTGAADPTIPAGAAPAATTTAEPGGATPVGGAAAGLTGPQAKRARQKANREAARAARSREALERLQAEGQAVDDALLASQTAELRARDRMRPKVKGDLVLDAEGRVGRVEHVQKRGARAGEVSYAPLDAPEQRLAAPGRELEWLPQDFVAGRVGTEAEVAPSSAQEPTQTALPGEPLTTEAMRAEIEADESFDPEVTEEEVQAEVERRAGGERRVAAAVAPQPTASADPVLDRFLGGMNLTAAPPTQRTPRRGRVDVIPEGAREDLDAIRRFMAERGVRAVFVQGKRPLPRAGVYEDGVAVLDARKPVEALRRVAYHELAHHLKAVASEEWEGLYRAIKAADRPGLIQALRRYRGAAKAEGLELPARAAQEEAVSQYVEMIGGYLEVAFESPERLVRLATRNPDLWTRIVEAVQRMLKSVGVGQGAQVDRDIETIKKASAIERGGDTKALASAALRVREALDATMGVEIDAATGEAVFSVYHGSAADFDEFSDEKIGSGEGAQVYGYGHYFASRRDVAEHYKRKMSSPKWWDGEAKRLREAHPKEWAMLDDEVGPLTVDHDRDMAVEWSNVFARARPGAFQSQIVSEDTASAILATEDIPSGGRLYEVELAPAEDEYLLWDEPFSKQSDKVKAALRSILPSADTVDTTGWTAKRNTHLGPEFKDWSVYDAKGKLVNGLRIDPHVRTPQAAIQKALAQKALTDGMTGQEIYGLTKDLKAPGFTTAGSVDLGRVASAALRAAGIRGIKYLDGGSRSKGDGTYNYVIFDPKDAKITGKFALRPDEAGFYSGLEAAISDKVRGRTATADQIRALLNNGFVKQEEWDWAGMDEYLRGKDRVVVADLLLWVAANTPRVKSVTASGEDRSEELFDAPDIEWSDAEPVYEDVWGLFSDEFPDEAILESFEEGDVRAELKEREAQDPDGAYEVRKYSRESEQEREYSVTVGMSSADPDAHPDFSLDFTVREDTDAGYVYVEELQRSFTTRAAAEHEMELFAVNSARDEVGSSGGGTRYAGFTLQPIGDDYAETLLILEKPELPRPFTVPEHWDEENVIAHIRHDTRSTVDPANPENTEDDVFFLEEVQSDWHQKGRERGYGPNSREVARIRAKPESEITEEDAAILREAMAPGHRVVPPDAPWKDTRDWAALALKHAVVKAVQADAKFVGWTTGAQQNARYRLSQVVGGLNWEHHDTDIGITLDTGRADGATWLKVAKDGKITRAATPLAQLEGQHVTDAFGTDLGRRILAEDMGRASGLDLDVGGEGMREFYDQILPSVARKFGKRYGSAPTKITLASPADTEVHGLPITDEMRKAVAERGFPRFALPSPDVVPEPERRSTQSDVKKAARKAAKEGEATTVGGTPLANTSEDPGARALQRGIREVRGPQEVQHIKDIEREAKARLRKDYRGERDTLVDKMESGIGLSAVETVMADTIKTDAAMDALMTGSKQDYADAIRFGWLYQDARAQTARALTVIRDSLGRQKTGREMIADMMAIPPRRTRRKLQKNKEALAEILAAHARRGRFALSESDAADVARLRAKIQKLMEAEAEASARVRQALVKAGFPPEMVTADYFKEPGAWAAISKIITTNRSGLWDWYIEFRLASMLSGTLTHTRNTVGNAAMHVLDQHVNRMAGAAANTLFRSKDAPGFGEVVEFYRAYIPAVMQASRSFAKSLQTEMPVWDHSLQARGFVSDQSRFEVLRGPAIPGRIGRAVRVPLSLLTAEDQFFKTLAAITEGHALAWRQATKEGLKGKARRARIAELLEDPHSPIMAKAISVSERVTFQDPPGKGLRSVMQFRDWLDEIVPGGFPLGSTLLPFVSTPARVFQRALEIPAHPMIGLYRLFTGQYRGDRGRLAEDTGKALVSMGITMLVMLMLLDEDEDGLPAITGSATRDEKDLAYRTAPPYSIRIGGKYYSYRNIEPAATVLATLADGIGEYIQHSKAGKADAASAALQKVVGSLPEQAADKTFLRTIGEIYDAATADYGGDARAARIIRDTLVTPMIPNIVRSTLRAEDPYLRESRDKASQDKTAAEAIWSFENLQNQAFPTRHDLNGKAPPVKRDLWGRPIKKGGSSTIVRMFNPVPQSQTETILPIDILLRNYNDRVTRGELGEAKPFHPRRPGYTYERDGVRHYFTEAEYDALIKESGEAAAAKLLQDLQRGKLNVEQPTEEDAERIEKALRDAREDARKRLIKSRASQSGSPPAAAPRTPGAP